ncbi:DUF6998 domain-containing protein [Xaviernesmea rhizosphaerae]|uniref:DUF6998 domain-containing protein n=1 Tax=Xaviernesmea rhizosphaerae TaxID=1672749 RepID=UPI003CC9FB0D
MAASEFTLDGNLIGDVGEAAAAERFGLKLSPRNGTGIDGHAPDGLRRARPASHGSLKHRNSFRFFQVRGEVL